MHEKQARLVIEHVVVDPIGRPEGRTRADQHRQKLRHDSDADCNPIRKIAIGVRVMPQLLAMLICASAAFRPSASLLASSFAQKCMKNRRGSSSSMWLWIRSEGLKAALAQINIAKS